VIVKINDRMNKKNHRLIDLTEAAARQLDIIQQGLGKVEIEIIKEG
jgi:rare lipoprotein A